MNPRAGQENPFRDEANPYAPPVLEARLADGPPLAPAGMWREGRTLVLHRNAQFPDRCVKSNQPAGGYRLKRNLNWHHPLVFLAVLFNLLVYVVLSLVMTKRATIYVPLSPEWRVRRWRAIGVGWGLAALGLALIVGGIAGIDAEPALAWLILAGAPVLLGGVIFGLLGARMVYPTKIDGDHIWLGGVCHEFLAELPEIQPPR